MKYFSKEYKTICMDLAGHGESGSRRQKYTMERFAKDVESVVRQVANEKIVLVGHSMGGAVVIEAAKLLEDKVLGIVAVDSFYTRKGFPLTQKQQAARKEKIASFFSKFLGGSIKKT